jgi:hypothetical protein
MSAPDSSAWEVHLLNGKRFDKRALEKFYPISHVITFIFAATTIMYHTRTGMTWILNKLNPVAEIPAETSNAQTKILCPVA